MDIEFGNVGELNTKHTGWFIGFSDWTRTNAVGTPNLRYMAQDALARTLHAKWMLHPAGDDRGIAKPPSEGRTISILVSESGRFQLEFSLDEQFAEAQTRRYTLQRHGDFIIWGENIYHRWFVEQACTILTLRWVPV
ncbi:MAG TPA: hypothetical protein IGS53_02610 [Leptolyngbyaceae cyanobacterium M33_DOE_097]|uniref:Signal peptidase I n=1 Tax=Oscillatoriales cyanobacterium SpSt-418 TaxID=2282169 RepID=A0A7C3PES7_9CYAN|nr:hypothetical protein [Leptolyngbyaceae cyanobacterium M33_DOE_097]